MGKTAIILNRSAGGGDCAEAAGPFLNRLKAEIQNLEIHWTDYAGHATELSRIARKEGVETIIAAGGDGTVFEVINGIFPNSGPPCKLGILPLGTGNSFLRDFGITNAEEAVNAIIAGNTQLVDVIEATHTDGKFHYINLLSIGFSAEAGALTNRRFKGLGLTGYALAVVVSLTRMSHPCFPYQTDSLPLRADPSTLISFSNSRFTGGTMEMAPSADLSDGQLDIIHIGPMSRRRLLSCFPKIYQGTHVRLDEIKHNTATYVTFKDIPETNIMVDGEILRLTLQRLQVLPGAIEVLR
jgi:diacylglycerol kinase (ATP)